MARTLARQRGAEEPAVDRVADRVAAAEQLARRDASDLVSHERAATAVLRHARGE